MFKGADMGIDIPSPPLVTVAKLKARESKGPINLSCKD